MMIKIFSLILIALVSVASAQSEQARLTKSLNNLDDLYYSYLACMSRLSTTADESSLDVIRTYRDAIQFELLGDTLWVKVFITTESSVSPSALDQLKSKDVRSLTKFGNILAARINLLQLPEIENLNFVQRIEPVVPDGYAARTTTHQPAQDNSVKKK